MVMKSSLRVLSAAALVGLVSVGVAQAEDTTTITTQLPDGSEKAIELQTTYGEGNTSVTQDITVLEQDVPFTYKFDNTYGDIENGTTSVDSEVTVLGQPVTFTYKLPADYTVATGRATVLSTANVNKVLFQDLSGSNKGGAVYNYNVDNSTVNLVADFVGNYAKNTSSSAYGGVIYNYAAASESAKIGAIKGDFVGNYAQGRYSYGGAIYNDARANSLIAEIGDITGNFIGNYAKASSYYAQGGAIYNNTYSSSTAKIGNITGDFIGNYASSTSNFASGGAIYNNASSSATAEIAAITGDFIGNYATSNSSYAIGGAIYNAGTISSIEGDFVGNHIISSTDAKGGAIYNIETLSSVSGNFIGNYASASSSDTSGGAIYNGGILTSVEGDFVGNHVTSTSTNVFGGAICSNSATIGDIKGDFVGNYAKSDSSTAHGGAIFNYATPSNSSKIADITGDFISNHAKSVSSEARGGAIYNNTYYALTSEIGDIKGDFIENHVISDSSSAEGGAIYNYAGSESLSAEFGDISGDFIGNYAQGSSAKGGAIYNYANSSATAKIGNVTGDFIGNNVKSASISDTAGGAIFNYADYEALSAEIGDITGDFISNYSQGQGGAIYNYTLFSSIAKIGNINGNFIANYAQGSGGAIYNYTSSLSSTAKIGNINGDFIANYAQGSGGAIYNGHGEIGDIAGDFTGNNAKNTSQSAYGGAIYNSGSIETITGNFKENYAISTSSDASGGAIRNAYNATIKAINGDFIDNYVTSDSSDANGGALCNFVDSKIGDITGNFVGNYGHGSYAEGGAIYNSHNSTINDITGDFIANRIQSLSYAKGGAIYNTNSSIGNVSGKFIGNYAQSGTSYARGGAIYNNGYSSSVAQIGHISGDFLGNHVKNTSQSAYGGAIENEGSEANIVSISGNFVENYTLGSYSYGGAISNTGTIGNIKGNFSYNYSNSLSADAEGGAIYNRWGSIGNITGDFVGNYAQGNYSKGGAIYNHWGSIGNITGDFVGNHVKGLQGASGGAIYVEVDSNVDIYANTLQYMQANVTNSDGSVYRTLFVVIDPSTGSILDANAIKSKLESGEVTSLSIIANESIPKDDLEQEALDSGFDSVDAYLDEMVSFGYLEIDPNEMYNEVMANLPPRAETHLTSDDVRGNHATLVFKNSDILNNYAESENNEAKGGAVYSEYATVKVEANDGERVLISGNYTKSGDNVKANAFYINQGKLIFDVTNGSTIQLDDSVDGNTYETYIIGDENSQFVLNNSIENSKTHLVETNLYLSKDTNLDGNELVLHSGQLSMLNNKSGASALERLTISGDTNVLVDVDLAEKTMDRFTAKTYGAHTGKLNVAGMNLLSDAEDVITTVPFAQEGLKEQVTYGGSDIVSSETQLTTLYTPIYKYGVTYNPADGNFVFNKGAGSVMSNSGAFNPAVLGGSTSATIGATATMNNTLNYAFQHSADHMNIPYLERLSMKNRNRYALGNAIEKGRFSPLYQPSDEEASVWVKPYATFETVGLKNGPKVHNNTYGTLVGFDSEMQSLRRGWDRVITGYIGYNGASQRYSGVDSIQNGGLIGGTVTMYKGNFFNATTVSVGANVAQNETMYGKDDFAMLLSGVGNKTGYNFEFKEGKLILQPSMLMSYTFVNTFDYTNAAGVRIDNKPLHALQLAPGLKVIGNLKDGWQPYASVSMVWNLMGESDATANGVKLPEMSIKPYVQYGVGVQKRIKDHFTAYGQAMIQNGGRNGISLTGGFRWALGHDNCKYEKTQRQSDENQKLTIKDNGRKIIKQMTPQQRAALAGGKYMNTSRTAKSGSLRQY